MTESPLVYIIILNWKNIPDTVECLDSLSQISYPRYEIILVNNDTDPFPLAVQGRYPHLMTINNGNNLGFTGGNNVGIEMALDKKADYVLILNNDTIVDPAFLDPLIDFSAKHSKTILSSAIYLYNSDQIENYGGKLLGGLGLGQRIKKQSSTDPDYLSGACLFAKAEYFKDIGLFDKDYFAYFEDADWCLRARRKGYGLKIIYESKIWHKHSASTKIGRGWGPAKSYYMARNSILFGKKNLKGIRKWGWFLGYFFLGSHLHLLFFCRSLKSLKNHYKGLWQGMAGV
ncbi:MAG: glycosyltransferase family 2 protein [Candidatus Omnitrophota bacterium]